MPVKNKKSPTEKVIDLIGQISKDDLFLNKRKIETTLIDKQREHDSEHYENFRKKMHDLYHSERKFNFFKESYKN